MVSGGRVDLEDGTNGKPLCGMRTDMAEQCVARVYCATLSGYPSIGLTLPRNRRPDGQTVTGADYIIEEKCVKGKGQ